MDWYVTPMSSHEISEKIKRDCGISISPRYIQLTLKRLGAPIRSASHRYILAIKKGRKTYDEFRKPIKSSALRSGISLKRRYEVLKRDNSRCVMCGATAQEEFLVVDHIKPVVNGGTNNLENLRVLCRACNHGKMISEERI